MLEYPISVVMAVYNGEEYLEEAIRSILSQSFSDFEFIIINDGSTDNSAEIIYSFNDKRIKLINQSNCGLASSLNSGIKSSQGKYIARMDDDDISLPDRFLLQYNFLNNNPDHILVGSNAKIIDEHGEFIYNTTLPTNFEEIYKKEPFLPIYHSSVMYLKEAALKCGLYDSRTNHIGMEDILLWNKMIKIGKFANFKDELIKYRLSPSALTTKSGKDAKVTNIIIINAVKRGYILEYEIEKIREERNKISNYYRLQLYYLLIAKKYLFNNLQPVMARFYLSKITTKNKYFEKYLLILLSYFPGTLIKSIYKKLKK